MGTRLNPRSKNPKPLQVWKSLMADSEAKLRERRTEKKNKKRKQKRTEEHLKSRKKHRISVEETEASESQQLVLSPDLHEGFAWRNLELILSIQNKDLHLQKKVELAFDFVESKVREDGGDDQNFETVKISRVVIFLSDWVQSLLIPSGKRIRSDWKKADIQVVDISLDLRCWKVFKFCLEESLRLKISLSFSRNLLQSIGFIAKFILSQLTNKSSCSLESCFAIDVFELLRIVLDCITLVFSSSGGLLNENLDLWLSTIVAVLELVRKIYVEELANGSVGVYVLQLSCLVFERFAKFLRAHPAKKNGFHDFIDKLLEPLLHFLGMLQRQTDEAYADGKINILKLVEDVLSHGLFHPVHIEGFVSLNSTDKYVSENKKDSKTVIKSYHRHLFAKLERIVATKELAACSVGKLFCLLSVRVRNPNGALAMSKSTKMTGKTDCSSHLEGIFLDHTSKTFSESSNLESEKSCFSSYLTVDKRKSLFDFFVLVMEPLLIEINGYLEHKHGVGTVFSDAHCTLKSINSLLASFMHENVYLRTENTSEGACVTFLKKVYDMIMSLSSALIRSSKLDDGDRKEIDMLTLLAEEVVVAVGYLLEIEYEVMGNDLINLWLTMLSHLALGLSMTDEPE